MKVSPHRDQHPRHAAHSAVLSVFDPAEMTYSWRHRFTAVNDSGPLLRPLRYLRTLATTPPLHQLADTPSIRELARTRHHHRPASTTLARNARGSFPRGPALSRVFDTTNALPGMQREASLRRHGHRGNRRAVALVPPLQGIHCVPDASSAPPSERATRGQLEWLPRGDGGLACLAARLRPRHGDWTIGKLSRARRSSHGVRSWPRRHGRLPSPPRASEAPDTARSWALMGVEGHRLPEPDSS